MQTTASSPAPGHLLDVTRTVSRAHLRPTGIDRIERAYLAHLIRDPAPLFGLLRTRLGFLLLDRQGCRALLAHCEVPVWHGSDALSRLSRRKTPARGIAESGLRKVALDRSTNLRLGAMLRRHMPKGTVYFNIGQTNFNDRVIHAVRSCPESRIAVYLHDTIPLDLPDTQTQQSRLAFRQFLGRVDRCADMVLCNSQATKVDIMGHARHLAPDRLHVLWPGLPDMTVGPAPQGPWTGQPYFLAIGTIEPRKNIGFLLDLWTGFAGPDDPHLILCGRRGWMNEAVFAALDQGPANVHELADLPDPRMWGLLEQSNGLMFPSRAEGFGYPAIEAAALNVPLICNSLPIFKEVLDAYPIYAAESDRYAWANKIKQLAQRRRDQGGEQYSETGFQAPTWQAHFNQLFTLL